MKHRNGKVAPGGERYAPRLMARKKFSELSGGRMDVELSHGGVMESLPCALWRKDAFHLILHGAWWTIFSAVGLSYLASWVAFAPLYYALSDRCGLDTSSFLSAMSLLPVSTARESLPLCDEPPSDSRRHSGAPRGGRRLSRSSV